MTDLHCRIEGKAGRITLTRPQALNAMTYAMCTQIEEVVDAWRDDDAVALIVMDAEGDRAFCAGGDIAELYEKGTAGDHAFGQTFWRDEYLLNVKLAEYPKPIVTFLNGFVMGGGVGLGCHASHRIVGESSKIALPECAIGLVPDVGGSHLLSRAPGRLGAYLGLTGHRMSAGDAIFAGFADHFVPAVAWPDLIATLCDTGNATHVETATQSAPDTTLDLTAIDRHFGGVDLRAILNSLRAEDSDFARATLKTLSRQNPLAMACCLGILDRLATGTSTIRKALDLEYRFTYRATEHSDFLEGIRAAVIDKDRSPVWTHSADSVPAVDVARMLRPLGPAALTFETETAT